jgi:hypothetical protein
MSTIFIGNYKRIQKDAKSIDDDGLWRELKYGGRLGPPIPHSYGSGLKLVREERQNHISRARRSGEEI